MIVRIAAMNVWSISRLNGKTPENREKKPITIIESWNRATIPPVPHVHLRNLIAI